jgi:hypothetical protein
VARIVGVVEDVPVSAAVSLSWTDAHTPASVAVEQSDVLSPGMAVELAAGLIEAARIADSSR